MADPSITLVTHRALPLGAPDDRLLADAITSRRIAVRFAVWNDPGIDWTVTPMALVRSAWDYHHAPQSWAAWIETTHRLTTLVNAPSLLHWSSDKRYLVELQRRGVPCVPTVVIESGENELLRAITKKQGWDEIVVKPVFGASSQGVSRFGPDAIDLYGQAHLTALLKRGAAVVQPYLRGVETARERSLVFIAGEFTHAFTKRAFSGIAVDAADIRLYDASDTERQVGLEAIAALSEQPVYARVDLVPTDTGPKLMELELVEPDLGLRLSACALQSLVTACQTIVDRVRS